MSDWSVSALGFHSQQYCPPPAIRLNTHNRTNRRLHMCIWTATKLNMHIFVFFIFRFAEYSQHDDSPAQMDWNWIENIETGATSLQLRNVLNHSIRPTERPAGRPNTNRLCQSECEPESEKQNDKKTIAANTELKDWCCPVMVFIVSEFGLINIFSDILWKFMCARAHPNTTVHAHNSYTPNCLTQPALSARVFGHILSSASHSRECDRVNFKCNWHLCTGKTHAFNCTVAHGCGGASASETAGVA